MAAQQDMTAERKAAADMYPKKIMEYMDGFLISKTMFAACELGVFDALLDAGRPLSAEEVSQAVGANLDSTERLLAACAVLELLNAHRDNGQVLYSNSEEARVFLTRSSPLSLSHFNEYLSKTIYVHWQYFTDAVREGKNQYEKPFGVNSKDLFQAVYRTDEEMMKFMELMNSFWNICGKDVFTAFDLSPFKDICDIGGCTGALAKLCTSVYPECTVKIFDLPKVVRMSREHFVNETEQRISFIEGDFFKDSLPPADLYILSRILHDWTDERCIELLRGIYKACKPGGGVLVVEMLLNEEGSGPLKAHLHSLNMLVQTEGKERTGSHYAVLLTAAGFTNVQHRYTGKVYDAVLGRKEK
ncbi:acetylserotonin O-methyltransferase [Kryptolebias marmoratus]|uniref:Acetylserotonin O-methyltransferase n=1 Tax=Kryptolebias marmoratus TaxID=37003 RepID=A0A3Q3H006_KRYMA|nr:acetylserotonin O-methyltransferase [Kryptolebias marmoratus]